MESYNTQLAVTVKPHCGRPTISYGIDNTDTITKLNDVCTLKFDLDLSKGQHLFALEFYKPDLLPNLAIEIVSVSIEGIEVDAFKWEGVFYPRYPKNWTGPQDESHQGMTYLGWAGRWELCFTAPVYTWIHQVENLGWIYTADTNNQIYKN